MNINPNIYVGLTDQKQMQARTGRKEFDANIIIEAVCSSLEIDREDLLSTCRKRVLAEARCIAIGLVMEANPDLLLIRVAKIFNRHHATILYCRQVYNTLYKRDKSFTNKVEKVLKNV